MAEVHIPAAQPAQLSAIRRLDLDSNDVIPAPRDNSRDDDERITLNVGGVRHDTLLGTLRRWPGTRLALLYILIS